MTSSRRRLLLVSQPVEAGVPVHVAGLVDALDPARWDITVACPPSSSLWASVAAGHPSVPLVPIGRHAGPRPGDLADVLRLLPHARRADVVHAHSSKAGLVARVAALATGRRGHTLHTPHGWSFWAFDGARSSGFALVERALATMSRYTICVSDYERDEAVRRGVLRRERARVVPNGVDEAAWGAEPQPVAGRIVMVARLAPPKRHVLALEALALLAHDHPEAELWFVGDGPLRAEVTAAAADLGVCAHVRFLGRRDDVPEILASASVSLLATGYEGCPLSVLEAMMAGVPVVVTRVGGIDELVDDDCGAVVEPTPEALRDALAELLDDPALAARRGKAARERARAEFSRERWIARTEAIYDEVSTS